MNLQHRIFQLWPYNTGFFSWPLCMHGGIESFAIACILLWKFLEILNTQFRCTVHRGNGFRLDFYYLSGYITNGHEDDRFVKWTLVWIHMIILLNVGFSSFVKLCHLYSNWTITLWVLLTNCRINYVRLTEDVLLGQVPCSSLCSSWR